MEVYLDYNATTPVDKRVLLEMLPYFSDYFGNAHSHSHHYGKKALHAVESSRQKVADFFGCRPDEVYFTSGSTESLNLLLKGLFSSYREKGNHIVTSKTEHKVVLDICDYLESFCGAKITRLDVDYEGNINLSELENSITEKTIFAALIMANHETGLISPMEKISEIVHAKGALLLSDTTQAAGKLSVKVEALGIDAACVSAHKIYGPKGVGAVYIRGKNPSVNVLPLLQGGGHENGIRSGTLNVPGIVGLGIACELAEQERWEDNARISSLRGYFEHQLLEIPGVRINGGTRDRLYNTSNLCFAGKKATDIVSKLDRIAISLGSACSSALLQPSSVLSAMGFSQEEVESSIRFSFGKYTTREETEYVVTKLLDVLRG
jgi:cysteine desulfurase